MGNVTIRKVEYKGWPNCIEMTNGIIDLIATTDVGPRIIRFGFKGKENEFCEVAEQIGTTGGNEWKIYGGHRLWHSPESKPRSYEPDNFTIQWREKENGIILTAPADSWTQIKKEIEVTMLPDEAKVMVMHRMTNVGAWDIKLAAWALTVMAPGGMEILPQVKRDTGLLPNWMISLWPYTKLNDKRVYWGEKYITLKQDPKAECPFKIGFPNEDGWAAYANNGHLFVKKYKHLAGVEYPDYASSYETYTCDFMLEMESLSPLKLLGPGETMEHEEVWQLYDNINVPGNEKEIDEFILPLIRK